MSQICGM